MTFSRSEAFWFDGVLSRYEPSRAKIVASVRIRHALRSLEDGRKPEYALYEILYELERLEAKRLGVRRDRRTAHYREFGRQHILMLAAWVAGQDPFIKGLKEAQILARGGPTPELDRLIGQLIDAELNRTSDEQRRRGRSPKREGPFNRYLRKLLEQDISLSEPKLWERIEADYDGGGSIFSNISINGLEIDDVETEECEDVSRDGVRNRLSRMREKIKKEKCKSR